MNRHSVLRRAATAVALLAATGSALAHPGHGGDAAAGFLHPLSGADHLLAMLAVGLWSSVGLPAARRAWAPLALVVAMVAGALIARGHVAPDWIELLVAASVIGMGVMVAAGARLPAAAGLALVSGVGLLHGAVHGFESAASAAGAYLGGMALATALLQSAGLTLGVVLRRLGHRALDAAASSIGVAGLAMLVARL